MNREYRIIMIALDKGNPEDYDITLTKKDKEAIE